MIKKKGSMDDPTAQTPGVSKSKRGGFGCAFFFCLIFLLGGAIPALLNVPGLLNPYAPLRVCVLSAAVRAIAPVNRGAERVASGSGSVLITESTPSIFRQTWLKTQTVAISWVLPKTTG